MPAPENPGKQLPVAARPSMLPGGGDIVPGGKFLHNLDIGGQSGSCKNSLQEVVAEDPVFGNTAMEGGFENVDVVNSFAAVGALPEEILINVRNDEGVRIHSTRSGEDPLEKGTRTAGRQGGSYPGL